MTSVKQINTYSIERPQIKDAAEIAKMHNQSWRDTYPNKEYDISEDYIESLIAKRETSDGIEKRQSSIKKSYEDPTYFLRIAKDEQGTIVGMVDGLNHGSSYELSGLYTATSTHGSGLGKSLWDAFYAWTNESKNVWLTVVTYNERAKAFYHKVGFQDVANTARFYKGTIIPVLDMSLRAKSNEEA